MSNTHGWAEAVRLAKRIIALGVELTENHTRSPELLEASPAVPLLEETGVGTITAAVVYMAWSHLGRVRSESAFAALAGVNPNPASSGNTVRRRLNRRGDRRLNSALHMATVVRMAHDPATRAHAERRKAEGKTPREIRRILKRIPSPAPLPAPQRTPRTPRTRGDHPESSLTDVEDSDHLRQGPESHARSSDQIPGHRGTQ